MDNISSLTEAKDNWNKSQHPQRMLWHNWTNEEEFTAATNYINELEKAIMSPLTLVTFKAEKPSSLLYVIRTYVEDGFVIAINISTGTEVYTHINAFEPVSLEDLIAYSLNQRSENYRLDRMFESRD